MRQPLLIITLKPKNPSHNVSTKAPAQSSPDSQIPFRSRSVLCLNRSIFDSRLTNAQMDDSYKTDLKSKIEAIDNALICLDQQLSDPKNKEFRDNYLVQLKQQFEQYQIKLDEAKQQSLDTSTLESAVKLIDEEIKNFII